MIVRPDPVFPDPVFPRWLKSGEKAARPFDRRIRRQGLKCLVFKIKRAKRTSFIWVRRLLSRKVNRGIIFLQLNSIPAGDEVRPVGESEHEPGVEFPSVVAVAVRRTLP
jgi:hypothetical protein